MDHSGSLDSKEMTELFKANNYEVDEKTVKTIYGITAGKVMNTTPETFEEITSSRGDLKRFRDKLRTLKELTLKKQEKEIRVAEENRKKDKDVIGSMS